MTLGQVNRIGKDNNLPWRIKSELAYVAKRTRTVYSLSKQTMVLIERKTWKSKSILSRRRLIKNMIYLDLTRKNNIKISEDENILVLELFRE